MLTELYDISLNDSLHEKLLLLREKIKEKLKKNIILVIRGQRVN